MIVWDLDGTLADCEHRRHFVDPIYAKCNSCCSSLVPYEYAARCEDCNTQQNNWKPNWQAFYEACDKDTPIQPVIGMWDEQISLGAMDAHQIWSGRCESVREKTEKWLDYHLVCFNPKQLKMRPVGDNTPDDQLKEKWLDEAIAQGNTIDFVFDDRPKVVRMWRRRGIFVFDVNQSGKEF